MKARNRPPGQSGAPSMMARRSFVARSYNHYYGSGLYDARYPRPNPPTFKYACSLARTASRILDFGAGSGRYALPLLAATNAFLCAYDISADACNRLEAHASAAGLGIDRLLVTSDLNMARAAGPYDLTLSLFGVLSHIEEREDRLEILNTICSLLSPDGVFLITVPNSFRRFPFHSAAQVSSGSENCDKLSGSVAARRYFPRPRLIIYKHEIENVPRSFPYYLYSRRALDRELSAGGFSLEKIESDSMFPERRLVQNPALERTDSFLCRLLPSWAGYGLRAVCRVEN